MDLKDVYDQIAEIKRAQSLIKDRVERMATRDVQNHSSGSWAPVFTGFTVGSEPASPICRYILIGKMCTCFVTIPNYGTSNAATFYISSPFVAATVANMYWHGHIGFQIDNTAYVSPVGNVQIYSGENKFVLWKVANLWDGWTTSGGKAANFTITYEIA